MSGRGMKKWAPYKSLKEQWETLDNIHEEEKKVEKPKISSEEAEVINDILVNYHGQELTIKYFKNGQVLQEKSAIKKIDAYDKKIYLVNRKVISMHDLVDIVED
ncbi:MAG: YolD-like family protein [Bacilli bacterium]|nr:YolD-like family protein [Bacilli bacterium]